MFYLYISALNFIKKNDCALKVSKFFQHQTVRGFKFGSNFLGRPRMFSHVYFIDGLLIDTGHSNMRNEVFDAISPLPVDQIFLTHHHEDHTGNLGLFQKHFNCPSYASRLCRQLMEEPPKISVAQWLIWGRAKPNFNIEVKENRLDTPQYSFELIPIPGHAVDMVALFERNEGWLFSADLFVSEYIRFFMRSESMGQQINSIKHILQLDFKVLFCSHNPQFENGKEKLAQKLDFFEDFYGNVARYHHEGYSVEAIFKAMGIKKSWGIRLLSTGELSTRNMINAVIRDEQEGFVRK